MKPKIVTIRRQIPTKNSFKNDGLELEKEKNS